jgi:galactose mutarotase-like enzyme
VDAGLRTASGRRPRPEAAVHPSGEETLHELNRQRPFSNKSITAGPGSETIQGFEVWTICSLDGGTRASFVPELGGAGSSLIVPGPGGPREVFYRYDFFWDRASRAIRGGWPFLFPICGRLERDGQSGAYEIDGRIYRMSIHGFAPYMPWNVVKSERPDELILQLTDTAATRKVYPFAFEVLLTYRVGNGNLVCEQFYTNRSDRPMPFYAGFHPYFVTPPPGAGKEKVRLYYEPKQRLLYNLSLIHI